MCSDTLWVPERTDQPCAPALYLNDSLPSPPTVSRSTREIVKITQNTTHLVKLYHICFESSREFISYSNTFRSAPPLFVEDDVFSAFSASLTMLQNNSLDYSIFKLIRNKSHLTNLHATLLLGRVYDFCPDFSPDFRRFDEIMSDCSHTRCISYLFLPGGAQSLHHPSRGCGGKCVSVSFR